VEVGVDGLVLEPGVQEQDKAGIVMEKKGRAWSGRDQESRLWSTSTHCANRVSRASSVGGLHTSARTHRWC